jgi:phosphatidylinositol kinase/protein kinase (PI-3  family)
MAEGAGRPSDLTEENLGKIRQGVLDGKLLKEIAKICGISELTIYDWTCKNYQDINTKIEGWKRDRKILLASQNIEEILMMDKEDKDKLKVIQDTSKFVLETLDKDVYSKRSELTGKDGKDLMPKPILDVQENNGNLENTGS